VIKDLNEIKWFDINNYSSVPTFDDHNWLIELQCRDQYYGCPFTGPVKGSLFSTVHEKEFLRRARNRNAYRYGDVAKWESNELLFTRPASTGDYWSNMECVFPSYDDLPIRRIPNGANINQFESFKVPYWVDLTVPDKILMMTFESILKNVRRKIADEGWESIVPLDTKGRVPLFTEPDFCAWANCGLLPYLDLIQWSLLTGEKISTDAIGMAIHGMPGQGRKIRETTRDEHANNAWKYLETLNNQVLGTWKKKDDKK